MDKIYRKGKEIQWKIVRLHGATKLNAHVHWFLKQVRTVLQKFYNSSKLPTRKLYIKDWYLRLNGCIYLKRKSEGFFEVKYDSQLEILHCGE
jgi:hypothetical protein